jgi:hypothetical protein
MSSFTYVSAQVIADKFATLANQTTSASLVHFNQQEKELVPSGADYATFCASVISVTLLHSI